MTWEPDAHAGAAEPRLNEPSDGLFQCFMRALLLPRQARQANPTRGEGGRTKQLGGHSEHRGADAATI